LNLFLILLLQLFAYIKVIFYKEINEFLHFYIFIKKSEINLSIGIKLFLYVVNKESDKSKTYWDTISVILQSLNNN